MGSTARLEPARHSILVRSVVALVLASWPAVASAQSSRASSRDSVVAALRQAGHDFSVSRLRDAERALAAGRRGEFEGIRQQNFCSVRAAGRDLDLACRYLEQLDAPAPVPAASGGAAPAPTSGLSLRRVQELLGRMVVAPRASIANQIANARCDGVGCAFVWTRACVGQRSRVSSDLRTCDTAGCVRDIELSAQLELDCGSVPRTLQERLPPGVQFQPRREFRGFTTWASSLAAARISVALHEAAECRVSARVPLRCLRPSASGDTHDQYVRWLRSLATQNGIAAQFPAIAASAQAELRVLAQLERRVAASCSVSSVSLEVSPERFFEAQGCSTTTLSAASWMRVRDHYTSLWQSAQRRLEAQRRAEAERRAEQERRVQAERQAEAERRAEEQRRIQAEIDRRQREQARQQEIARRAAAERARRQQERRDRRRTCHRQCDSGCSGNANCTRQCIAQTCS